MYWEKDRDVEQEALALGLDVGSVNEMEEILWKYFIGVCIGTRCISTGVRRGFYHLSRA